MPSLRTVAWLSWASVALFFESSAADHDFNYFHRHQAERMKRMAEDQHRANFEIRSTERRYYNDKTAPYFIESWPDVPFDAGEFYSGSIPIDESNENRTLFFIFKPAQEGPSKDLTIWLNGGPGCSSLVGFFQENGPILWQPGIYEPQRNPYAWSKLTNMIWVEQPVGTGFATGTPTAKNEADVAKDFVKFFKNFEKLFGIENYKIYVTGESYAGRYVPYISGEMLDQNDKKYFDLGGMLVYDPCIGEFVRVGQEIPTYPFVKANNNILNLNQSFLEHLEAQHSQCGYEDYIDKYMTFPPPEHQPDRGVYQYKKCDIFDQYYYASIETNPCYNVYHITDYCPLLCDPASEACPPVETGSKTGYFNRKDVKKALHAPMDVRWTECSDDPVFVGKAHHGLGAGPEGENDRSPDPIQGVLPKVIEATNRVMVGNADWDGLLLTNGTLLSIQNMTWNGKLGFQSAPASDFYVPLKDKEFGAASLGSQGVMGKWHYERGLMWVEQFQAGHMVPQYQPRSAWRQLQWLLGDIDDFN